MDQAIVVKLKKLLADLEFISIATSDKQGKPNAAPKFLLKIEGSRLYIVDCVMGQTWKNLISNPFVSIPIMDVNTLVGHRINGKAYVIEEGALKQSLSEELSHKQITLSTRRIIEGIKKEKKHESLEVEFPEVVGMFFVEVSDVVEIGPTGNLVRQNSQKEKR